jgi:hypothetical protein
MSVAFIFVQATVTDRRYRIGDWQSAIVRDIVGAQFGEVAEWSKAALC